MKEKNRICTRCDARNTENARYCAGCGYELPKPVAENVQTQKQPVYYQTTSSNKTLIVIISILIGVSVLLGATSIFFTYTFLNNPLPASISNQMAVAIAGEMNKHCPAMIDNLTRLDNVVALPDNKLQYNYTLGVDKSQVDTVEFKKQMNLHIVESIKTQPMMVLIRKSNMHLKNIYKDSSSNYICTVEISPEQYN